MSVKQLIPEIRALMQDGFYIFPVHITPDHVKKPAVKGYLKLQIDDVDKMIKLFEKVGANAIGMAPALNGLVVLDVDSYKPECNFIDLQGLDTANLDTLTVETGRGGRHYYFDAAEGVRYKGKIAGIEAVDIKHRGFVVMPPSNGYKWINETDILPAPEWLPTRENTTPKASNPLANIGKGQSDTLINMVRNAANTMDDRDDWLKVGLGLHDEYHGSSYEHQAKQAFIDWSCRWDIEDGIELAIEAEKVWDHAGEDGAGGVTGATTNFLISKMAKKGQPPIVVDPNEETLDWLDEELPPPDWLVEGFLEKQEIMGLAGASNAGKTRWLCMLAAALSAGRPDLVGITKEPRDPVRVMMVSNEENTNALKRRVRAAYILNKLTLKEPIIWAGQGWLEGKPHTTLLTADPESRRQVVNEAVVDAIIEKALINKATLITFDPYITLGINNENEQTDNNELFGVLRRIAEETGAAILFIHHTGKGEKRTESPDTVRGLMSAFRGSSVITSSMDSGFSLLPYLTFDVAKNAGQRTMLAEAIKAGTVPNYVALDWVKRREAKMGAAKYYVIEGVQLPDGYEIAAMKPVTEEVASLTQTMAMGVGGEVNPAMKKAAAEINIVQVATKLEHDFDHGDRLSLNQIHKCLSGRVTGWPVRETTPQSTSGVMAYALKELQGEIIELPNGKLVKLVHEAKSKTSKGGYKMVVKKEGK